MMYLDHLLLSRRGVKPAILSLTAIISIMALLCWPQHTSTFTEEAAKHPAGLELDWQNVLGLVLAFLVSALANSAGVGGGAFLVPLFNLVVGFSLKRSTALSQATMAGGAIAGVFYGLFHSNPTKPGLPVVSFRLALELGPPLILGTSIGVLINPLVPDWLLVVLLTITLLLLATRVTLKAVSMHAAETALLSPTSLDEEDQPDSAVSPGKSGHMSPFDQPAGQSLPALKVKSHPVILHDSMSPAASGADSLVWDLDDELPPSPLGNGGEPGPSCQANTGPESSALHGDFRQAGDGSSHSHHHHLPEPHLSRFAAESRSNMAGEAVPVTPYSKRRGRWTMILLEALLLLAVVAAFLALQMVKSQYNKCTTSFAALYGAQGLLCLTISTAWIGLPALLSRRRPASDVEAPLLSRVGTFITADPTAGSLFIAAVIALLGGCLAGLVGLGGGVVLSPLLVELGVHPLVAAATSILLVACSSSSAAAEFALEDALPFRYAAPYFCVCALGSVSGFAGIGTLVRRSGRSSYLVFIIAVVIATGGVATAATGGIQAIQELRRQGFSGFHSICDS